MINAVVIFINERINIFVSQNYQIETLSSLCPHSTIPDGGQRAHTISTISRGGLGNKGPQLEEPSSTDIPSFAKESK